MNNLVYDNGEKMDYTAGGAISSGDVVLVGVRVGIAETDIANGETGALRMTGVVEVAKASNDTVGQGALLYWDVSESNFTTTTGGNYIAGYAFAAAASGVSTALLNLNA